MKSENFKPVAVKRKIALVQGESFRCVAVETQPGQWQKVEDKSKLSRVFEIVSVLGYSEASFS